MGPDGKGLPKPLLCPTTLEEGLGAPEGGWEPVCLGCHPVTSTVSSLPVVGAPSLSVKRANECEKQESGRSCL